MIRFADLISNKKLNPIVTELFIRSRKLKISIVFIRQSYFKVLKKFRLNTAHFFIMKIPNKRELQKIAINRSSDTDFKDFMKIYKKVKYSFSGKYSFLVNDTTLSSDNSLQFRTNLLSWIYNKIMTNDDQIKDETHNMILTEKVVGNGATQDTFLKSQGKCFLSFLCTLFYIFLIPKNYRSSL